MSAKKIAFVAGTPSHPPRTHEHNAGCLLLAGLLEDHVKEVETAVHCNGWPEEPGFFDGVSSIVIYADGGPRHPIVPHLAQVAPLMEAGVGLALLHYAVEVQKEDAGPQFLDWTGGFFETHWSVNPHWTAEFTSYPDHPVTRGVKPFAMEDEWYYHMRFRENMEGVTPVMSAIAPESTLVREDGPHSGNPYVRQSVANGEPQHLAWARERADGGRGFGFTGGHYHDKWAVDDLRKAVLNGIVWTAGLDIPEGGIETPTPGKEELDANLDPK